MLRLFYGIYVIGFWVTFFLLTYNNWDQCIGLGGCARLLLINAAWSIIWPVVWFAT